MASSPEEDAPPKEDGRPAEMSSRMYIGADSAELDGKFTSSSVHMNEVHGCGPHSRCSEERHNEEPWVELRLKTAGEVASSI